MGHHTSSVGALDERGGTMTHSREELLHDVVMLTQQQMSERVISRALRESRF